MKKKIIGLFIATMLIITILPLVSGENEDLTDTIYVENDIGKLLTYVNENCDLRPPPHISEAESISFVT